MLARAVLIAVVAIGLFSGVGCGPGKLNESRTWEMGREDVKALDLPAVAKPQTIKVEFTSSDADVEVCLFKEADAKGDAGLSQATTDKALGKANGKGGNFSAEVPENTATRVVAREAKGKTKVDIKVTNQK